MSLYDYIKQILPEISDSEFGPGGSIILQNDSDGIGDYIVKWEYSELIPEGFIVGKPEIAYVIEPTPVEPVVEPVIEPTPVEPVVEPEE